VFVCTCVDVCVLCVQMHVSFSQIYILFFLFFFSIRLFPRRVRSIQSCFFFLESTAIRSSSFKKEKSEKLYSRAAEREAVDDIKVYI